MSIRVNAISHKAACAASDAIQDRVEPAATHEQAGCNPRRKTAPSTQARGGRPHRAQSHRSLASGYETVADQNSPYVHIASGSRRISLS